jgi:ribonuclease P protein component
VVLHPRRSVIDLDFATLDLEVAQVFKAIRKATRN